MSLLETILILVLSFSGIAVGVFLRRIIPEEMEPGRKWFGYLQRSCFVFLGIVGGYILYENILLLISFVLICGLWFFLKDRFQYGEIGSYIVFFLPFTISFTKVTVLFASLLFIYGLPTGTLMPWQKKI